MTDTQVLNRWVLYSEGGLARPRPDLGLGFTPFLLDPPGAPAPTDGSQVMTVNYVGVEGNIILSNPNGWFGNFQRPVNRYPSGGCFVAESSAWHLRPLSTGDGYFILAWPNQADPSGSDYVGYIIKHSGPNGVPGNPTWFCLSVDATAAQAARFTATGLDRGSVMDIMQVSHDAHGMSFAGVDMTNGNLAGANLQGCDFRHVKNGSLNPCSVFGSQLQGAHFAGLKLAGLQMAWSDATGADFTGCDFTGLQTVPNPKPPIMVDTILTGAVIPGGAPWTTLAGATLAEATVSGADLAGTDLTGADFSGDGVTIFSPAYQSDRGIDVYDLLSESDRVIAFDYDADRAHPRANYLVCYRPGHGACAILDRTTGADGGVTFGHVYFQGGGGNGIGGYNLSDPADQIIAFDYGSTGNLDHLVCYRPGAGWVSVIEKKTAADGTITFDKAWDSTTGIGGSDGCNLSDPADRIIAYDYAGTGRLDHLLCYRPGTGHVWILEKDAGPNGTVTFTAAFASTTGIGGYPLGNAADQIVAVDHGGTGRLDHLLCYGPGTGTASVVEKRASANGTVTFAPILSSTTGLGGCDLKNPADRIVAFDYDGSGLADHLVCSRPAAGTVLDVVDSVVNYSGSVWILRQNVDQQKNPTYTPVLQSTIGIAGYDLTDPRDRVIAFDYAGTGDNALVCYRPGAGIVWVIPGRPARPARLGADAAGHVCDLSGANLTSTQLAGAELNGVNLTGATLVGTDLTGTDLTRTTFSTPFIRSNDPDKPTILAGCTVPFAVLGLEWSYLDLTSALIIARPDDLTGLIAISAQLPGFDFDGAVLDGANLAGATLTRAQFTRARIRKPSGGAAPSFAGATLTGAFFTGAVLDQVSFSGATLGGVTSSQGANFSSAWISGCDFSDANAFAVVFADATLVGANTLTGVADLQESDFSGAYLPNTKFTGASLQGANFDGACMIGCDLTNANLGPADNGAKIAKLDAACLQAVVFEGVILDSASMANAAATDQDGQIPVSHYDEDGTIVGPEALQWRARSFPSADSLTDDTVCPNNHTYKINQGNGATIKQMMTAPNPPTKWAPVDTEGTTRRGHGHSHGKDRGHGQDRGDGRDHERRGPSTARPHG